MIQARTGGGFDPRPNLYDTHCVSHRFARNVILVRPDVIWADEGYIYSRSISQVDGLTSEVGNREVVLRATTCCYPGCYPRFGRFRAWRLTLDVGALVFSSGNKMVCDNTRYSNDDL